MNIKKSGGKGIAEYAGMMEHLRTNYDFLHRQIEIISPEIIIFGTSWDELRDGLFPNIKWQKSGYDVTHRRSRYRNFHLKIISASYPFGTACFQFCGSSS